MGCGSSSLKGDNPTGVGGAAEDTRPARKVNTNFNTPDYDTGADKQRRMTEYAPHETERPKSAVSKDDDDGPGGPAGGPSSEVKDVDDKNLKPYETLSDGQNQGYPHESAAAGGSSTTPQVNGDTSADVDPTSQSAKDTFAATNDPANNAKNTDTLNPDGTTKERKRSWFGEKYKSFTDARDNRPAEGQNKFTDEELKKYTGKSNEEVKGMVEEGKGVGGGQSASMRDSPGPGTGIGFGGGVGSGGGAA